MVGQHLGTGTKIARTLEAWGIRQEGCGSCGGLQAQLDSTRREDVIRDVEAWTDKLIESAKTWRQETGSLLPLPPRIVVRLLILYAARD